MSPLISTLHADLKKPARHACDRSPDQASPGESKPNPALFGMNGRMTGGMLQVEAGVQGASSSGF
jgi:hypothetical protein